MPNDRPPLDAEYQFTREDAAEFAEKRLWEPLTPAERGMLQLRQDRMCMPIGVILEGMQALFGRPVFGHELAKPQALWEELHGVRPKADLAAILDKLPVGPVIVVSPNAD